MLAWCIFFVWGPHELGIVFDTCVGEGVFICGTARSAGYRFQYPQWKGAHLAFLGIVFDTRGYGERRTESGKRKTEIWQRAGIVFDTHEGCGYFLYG